MSVFDFLEKKYKEDKYFILKTNIKELCEEYKVSRVYMEKSINQLGYNKTRMIKQFVLDYPPYKYSLKELRDFFNIRVTRSFLNKHYKAVYGIGVLAHRDKLRYELEEDYKDMFNDYKFPIIQLGYLGMAKYIGTSYDTLKRILKKYKYTKDKELKKLFTTYLLSKYTPQDIADIVGISVTTVWKYIHYLKLDYSDISYISYKYASNELYGNVSTTKKYTSLKDIKKFFEDKLKKDKYITTKYLRSLGYKSFGNRLNTIKYRYGLDVNYIYNKKLHRYELKE